MRIAAKINSFLFQQASLTTRFAVHSLICIGIMTVALWFLVSELFDQWDLAAGVGDYRSVCKDGSERISNGGRFYRQRSKAGGP